MPYKLREGLSELPERIKSLPIDERGYPVPWFVAWKDDKPEFRCMDGEKLIRAHNENRCWVCGERLGRWLAFVIGPMCALNRISAEPPSHRECAEFSAKACPFLTKPQMHRRENELPDGVSDHGGASLKRNPGVALVWVTRSYELIEIETGWLFKVGDPSDVACYAQGRVATADEIRQSIESGLPLVKQAAISDGPAALAEIETRKVEAYKMLGVAA